MTSLIRRAMAAAFAFAACAASVLAQSAVPSIPVTGEMLPGMERFDPLVTSLMTKFNSPGAQLAITRNGRLVLARGYGFANRDTRALVQPDSLFRTASIGKIFTAVSILTLVEQGKLDLEAKAIPLLGLTPLPNAANNDPRLQNITVRQLLHHTGGWDRDISGDVTGQTTTAANAAGVTAPANVDTVIRYALGQKLDFDPGTRYAYSNLGYMILGRIVEKLSAQAYPNYVNTALFAKAGITRAQTARTLLENRYPNEVRYYDYPGAPLVRSVFPPTTVLVPAPDGGVYLENRYATGGWVMTAVDYVRILCAIDGSRAGPAVLAPASIDLLTERPAPPVSTTGVNFYAMALEMNVANGTGLRANWFHDGGYPGTLTYFVRYSGGWTYAMFFNSAPDEGGASDISAAMGPALSATTPPATGDLFLTVPPQIVTPPAAQSANAGGSVTFTAAVVSLGSPTYQWFKDGTAIAGATNLTLKLDNLTPASAGSYRLAITNSAGTNTTTPAVLTINGVYSLGRLVNLSILTDLENANDSFTMGYVVGGAGTSGGKPLVIRAAGPSLGALGVPGTLADPKIELYAAGTKTMENDNWEGSPTLVAAMNSVGAFAFANAASRDAAIVTTIGNGDNSVKVLGTGAGKVIAELYDATAPQNFSATTPRLLNVSVLKQLGEGLTVGFAIGGATSRQVLIRAVGPTLGAPPFSVPGAVADPQLALFKGDTRIDGNNDWGGTAALSAAFSQVGAFALPATSKDAALLLRLDPGTYTVQVSGVGNTTGTAIVEVYEVP